MNDKTFPYWLAVEESKTVCFSDLAHMMAKAMHPGEHELMSYAAARINLEGELKQAVKDGVLTPRNAAGLGRHTFPQGDALQSAVFIPRQDLEPFLNDRGIELRLTPHGSGPDYWTLENAAAALQEQLNWHDGARAELQDQMQEAATTGALAILDPHTCLPTRSKQVHTYWELVTPASVNNWLEKQGVPYRWRLTPPEVELESNEASNPANNSEAFPWPKVMHGQRVWRLSKAIDEIARALNWHQSQRDRLMAQAVKAGTAGVLVLRDLYAGGIAQRGDNMSELLDYVFSKDMNAWLDLIDAPFAYRLPEAEPEQEPQAVVHAPQVAHSASDALEWTVRKPLRYNGYTAPLHRLLAAAHREGKACPSARDVVNAWRDNAPLEIAKVLPDGFDYYDANGNTKTADLEAIRKAIGRMRSAR